MFIQSPRPELKRSVGLLLLCLIGIDGTIGGSIFVLLAGGVELAGSYTPLAFVIGGLLALLGGLLYAEVGTTIPRPGADLAYVFTAAKKRYYPFLFSWCVLLGDIGYLAINALGFGFYTSLIFGISPVYVALGALVLSAVINLRGAKSAGSTEGVTLGILLLLIAAYGIYVAQSTGGFQVQEVSDFRLSGVLAASALIFTSYVGYEYIATLAGEVKRPEKVIPLALVITILVSTTVFSLIAYISLVGAPLSVIAESDRPLIAVTEHIGGIGSYIIIPAAILATGGSLIAATMVASRRLYALSHEGFFGNFLTKTNTNEVPVRAIIICCAIAGLLVLSQAVVFVAYMSNTVYLIGLIVIAISVMVLRVRRPFLPRPFKVPFFPLVPLAIIALAATLLLYVQKLSIAIVTLWFIVGWGAYLLSGINKQRWRIAAYGALIFLLILFGGVYAITLYSLSIIQ